MRLLATFTVAFVLLALTGCAATIQPSSGSDEPLRMAPPSTERLVLVVTGSDLSTKSEDWGEFQALWKASMAVSTAAQNIRYSYQTEAPANPVEPGTLVTIDVEDYRFVSQGARLGLGIMTGNAFVKADTVFTELPAGIKVGSRRFETSSSAGQGIFSAMTAKQVQAICDEIVKMVMSAK